MKIALAFLFCFGNIFAQVPSYVPTNGLVGWWGFNQHANDASVNGNHGTPFGASYTYDRQGLWRQACILNNLDDYIKTSGATSLDYLKINNQITISLWFQIPKQFNPSSLYLIGNGLYNQNGFFIVIDQNNQAYGQNNYNITFKIGTDASVSYITNQNEVGNWTNVIGTYQSGVLSLYVNGKLKKNKYVATIINSTDTKFVFADWDNPTTPNEKVRKIDDIGIWNRAITLEEISILSNSPISVTSTTISNVTCFNGTDGSATVVANGGTPPYTYSWNTVPIQTTQVAVNLRSGVYAATVLDSKGFRGTSSITITQPNEIPAPTITGEQNICLSSSPSTFTVNQIPGFSIEWEKPRLGSIVSYKLNAVSIIWNASGTDSVRVKIKDNVSGCERDTILRVMIMKSPEPLITGDARACENQSPKVYRVQKQSGRTYSWSKPKNGIIVGSTTSDSISVQWVNSGSDTLRMEERDNATKCTKDTSFLVSIAPLPDVTIIGSNQVRENEQGITYSVKNESGLSYDWTIVSGDATIAGKTGNSVTLNAGKPGTVKLNVKVTNQNGCMSESELSITVKSLTGIREISSAPFTLYPNPAGDHLYVKMDAEITGDIDIELYDVLGNRHFKQTYQTTEIIRIPVQALSQGMYMIKVKTLQGEYMERFVK